MDVYEAIEKRHMVRGFTGEPVARDILDRMLHAAALAPSAYNKQPWRFHVATGKTREEIVKALSMCTLHVLEYFGISDESRIESAERWYANLGNAPVAIAISVPKAGDDELDRINSYLSAGTALENMLLVAVAEGVACCNVTASFWVRDALDEILEIPEDREILSVLMVGHPAEEPWAPPHVMDLATFYD